MRRIITAIALGSSLVAVAMAAPVPGAAERTHAAPAADARRSRTVPACDPSIVRQIALAAIATAP